MSLPLSRRRALLGACGLAALGGAAGFRALAAARGLTAQSRAGLAFGTTVSLTAAGPDPTALDAALADAMAAMREVEHEASLFRPDSALSRLNREGRLGDPPHHLATLLAFALALAAETEGAFDPTVQPLWPLWSQAAERGERPGPAALKECLARIGWRRVRLSPEAIVLEKGTEITLNALVQGYAADVVMAALRARGIGDAFVNTGEFGAAGTHPDGTPWRLGIADPRHRGDVAAVITPFTGFAATSGDYNMAFSPDFIDHHIYDPATGYSPRGLASVTVTAPSGLVADGLSTACMVLGQERGSALVARRPGCALRASEKS